MLERLVVALIALGPLPTGAADLATARLVSTYVWEKDRPDFGGYSGIVLSQDGRSFQLLSDRAHLIEGHFTRHANHIIGVRSKDLRDLALPEALLMEDSEEDSEGIAIDRDGRLFVSLETDNKIVVRDNDGEWSALPTNPALADLPNNRGLEALAIDRDGAVYAIPEASASLVSPFPVFRYRDAHGWDVPFSISRSRGFVPVGADFDSNGRLYVLERGFSGFGFSTRVRRFDTSPDQTKSGETLLTTPSGHHDNLEGIAVWRSEDGEIRLTMVSDDNQRRFQKTEIVEYAVTK